MILFPRWMATTPSSETWPAKPSQWTRLFRLQHPSEAAVVRRVAWYSSAYAQRPAPWVQDLLHCSELIMVIEKSRERARVDKLIGLERRDEFQPWNIPQDIRREIKFWNQKMQTPGVLPTLRVVDSVENILTGQALQVMLHCNPCKYFGLEGPVSPTFTCGCAFCGALAARC